MRCVERDLDCVMALPERVLDHERMDNAIRQHLDRLVVAIEGNQRDPILRFVLGQRLARALSHHQRIGEDAN